MKLEGVAVSKLTNSILAASIDEVKHNRLLTPLVLNYRISQGRYAALTDEFGVNIVKQLLEEQNERVHTRSKRTSYSGGSANNCMRRQEIDIIAADKVKEPDYRLSLIFEDGNWRNLKWIVEFHRMGILKEFEVSRYNSKVNLSWTPDARVDLSKYYGEEYADVPVEIKGMNDWEFTQFRNRSGKGRQAPSRIMQIHAYMLAEDKDHWLVFAENKNTQDIEEYWCKRDPNIIKLLKRKYAYMLKSRTMQALPAIECGMHEGDSMYNRCPRNQECTKYALAGYPSLPPMKKKEELEQKAREAFV